VAVGSFADHLFDRLDDFFFAGNKFLLQNRRKGHGCSGGSFLTDARMVSSSRGERVRGSMDWKLYGKGMHPVSSLPSDKLAGAAGDQGDDQ